MVAPLHCRIVSSMKVNSSWVGGNTDIFMAIWYVDGLNFMVAL